MGLQKIIVLSLVAMAMASLLVNAGTPPSLSSRVLFPLCFFGSEAFIYLFKYHIFQASLIYEFT